MKGVSYLVLQLQLNIEDSKRIRKTIGTFQWFYIEFLVFDRYKAEKGNGFLEAFLFNKFTILLYENQPDLQ